jgi:uncharacterized protein
MAARTLIPHLPRLVAIESYGRGGFRFGGMSHRGSLLCLPSGIWAWPPTTAAEITEESLEPVFVEAGAIGYVLIGAGGVGWLMPAPLRRRFGEAGITVEVMRTGDAANTYNILLGEGRRLAAALIAVD